jgi:hypothetical protein
MFAVVRDRAARNKTRSSGRDEYDNALRRLQQKQQIIGELINGRLDLLEAGSRFLAAEKNGEPEYRNAEEVCRAVIGWVHLALNDRPERAEALSQELEHQLQIHLSRFGSIRLPLS